MNSPWSSKKIPWTREEFESLKQSLGMVDRLYKVPRMHNAAGWPFRELGSIQYQMYKVKDKEVLYLNYLPNRDFTNLDIEDLISKIKDINRPIKEIIKDSYEIAKITNIIKRNPRKVLAKIKELKGMIESIEVATKLKEIKRRNSMGARWPKVEFELLKKNVVIASTLKDLTAMHQAAGYTYRNDQAIQKKLYKEKFNEVIYIKYLPNRDFVGGDIKDLILKVKEYNLPFNTIIGDANIIVKIANTIHRDPKNVLDTLIALKAQFESHEIATEIATEINKTGVTLIPDTQPNINKTNAPLIPDPQPSINENTQLKNILISTISSCNPKLKLNQVQALALTIFKSNELTVTGYGSDTTIAVFKIE